jgi:hypothetical protein
LIAKTSRVMAFFLSPLSDHETAAPTAKFSLPTHVKMHRMWMFAMLKDSPSPAETVHIMSCETCGQAFRAAHGVSGFGKSSVDQQRQVNPPPTSSGNDVPKAVA